MTSVKNQGGCGSCVAFGAVGATEAQHKIAASNPSWNLDLSEQHLFSCGGGQCGYGWYISAALNRLRDYGTPDEACYPYQARDGSCSAGCSDWQSRAFKIARWSWVANNPSALEAALMNGPLVAGFTVYSDFFSYRSGIYHHTSGNAVGGHAIVIVGYDSVEQYWIVKNSWGSSWGESGYFRIGFGEAGIENYVASITVNPIQPPAQPSMSLTGSPNGVTVSSPVALNVQVISGGGAVRGATVTFNVDGAQVGSGVSDSSGYASYTYSVSSPKTYSWNVRAEAQGYNPATSETWAFTVQSPTLSEVAVKSKTIFGAELSGVRVKVDRRNYATPFTLTLQSSHTFTARGTATVKGVRYSFVEWRDENDAFVSAGLSFTYDVQSAKTFYAVYKPPQGTITVQLKDANTRKAVAGALVYLDGSAESVGATDSSGRLVIREVYAGTHQLKITLDGYNPVEATIELKRNTRFRSNLTPTG
jgi:hypothetical protein